jgi:hypothetical protein
MTKLAWDVVGTRRFETGVDHGVLFIPDSVGAYTTGYAWNGLTTVTESPSGAEATPTYADNIKYLNLISVEQFEGTIEAYTYPDEFAQCDGSRQPEAGVYIGQQTRKLFGFCYRTKIGNDLVGNDLGYKLHLVYNALAAPSERAYGTVNETPEAIDFSWEFTTTPVDVGTIGGTAYKPTATLVIDSTKVNAGALATLEDFLYGTVGTDPSLPTPAAVIALFSGTVTVATPTAPTYNSTTKVITIPTVTGVTYKINGVTKTGTVTITEDTVVNAYPNAGYKFPAVGDDDWFFSFS